MQETNPNLHMYVSDKAIVGNTWALITMFYVLMAIQNVLEDSVCMNK